MKDTENVLDFNAFMEFFTARLVHHSQLTDEIYLHIRDIIQFSVVPNPIRPGQQSAGAIKFIGRVPKSVVRP